MGGLAANRSPRTYDCVFVNRAQTKDDRFCRGTATTSVTTNADRRHHACLRHLSRFILNPSPCQSTSAPHRTPCICESHGLPERYCLFNGVESDCVHSLFDCISLESLVKRGSVAFASDRK